MPTLEIFLTNSYCIALENNDSCEQINSCGDLSCNASLVSPVASLKTDEFEWMFPNGTR